MQLVVDSLLTNYQKQGSGKKVIIMIHGWADKLQTFDELTSDLAKKYTVYRMDLPGFGQTQAPNEPWGLDEYVMFIDEFNKKLKINHVHAYIGHSNGCAVLVRGFSNNKIKSDKLILLAAAGIRNKNKLKKLGIKAIAKTGKAATFWVPRDQKQKLQKKLYGTVGSDMLVAPHLKETFKKTVMQDVQSDAARILADTLIIYGMKDSATPNEFGDIYHNLIKNSKLVKVDDAGHMLHHHQPEKTAKIVEDFL